jgi:hypothetical protein
MLALGSTTTRGIVAMNFRFALSALTAVAIATSVPALAAAQTTTTGPDGRTVIASTPVPNPPERPHMRTHHRKHHVKKHHHKRHHRKHHRHSTHGAAVSTTAKSDAGKKH